MSIERAISIRQPFVELILQGVKREEYRSRPTNIRERVYLYASLQPFESDEEWAKVEREPGQLPVGLILGTVDIVDCRPDPIRDGYAYVLRDPVRLAQPLKALNQPQPVFWRPEFPLAGTEAPLGDGTTSSTPAKPRKAKRAPPHMYEPDVALAAIIGPDAVTQSKVVSKLWAYIVKNNLQDQHKKNIVNADDKLQSLFGKNQISLLEMANLLGDHLR